MDHLLKISQDKTGPLPSLLDKGLRFFLYPAEETEEFVIPLACIRELFRSNLDLFIVEGSPVTTLFMTIKLSIVNSTSTWRKSATPHQDNM